MNYSTNHSGTHWLSPTDRSYIFPPVENALVEPDGLLAVGGDLSPKRILSAYQQGVFPWYSHGQPILWWSPDPRAVIFPDKLKISRSLRKTLNKKIFQVCHDVAFNQVINACATTLRHGQDGTWIQQR